MPVLDVAADLPLELPVQEPTFGLALPYYHPPEELTQRARIVKGIDLELGKLKNAVGTGKAILKLWVNEVGEVDRVETESSNLDGIFDEAVQSQFRSVLFQPAEQNGIRVKSLMRIEVEVLPPR